MKLPKGKDGESIARYLAGRTSLHFAISTIIQKWEEIRPQDDAAKELAQAKADIAELNQRLHERTQAFLARESKPVAATPLTFGDPPVGYTWHNPENLTPEQVEVDKGWRLLLVGEIATKKRDDVWICGIFHSVNGYDGDVAGLEQPTAGFRTKAPLPEPKPTPEEIERREFEAVMLDKFPEFCWASDFSQGAFAGWKAARAK